MTRRAASRVSSRNCPKNKKKNVAIWTEDSISDSRNFYYCCRDSGVTVWNIRTHVPVFFSPQQNKKKRTYKLNYGCEKPEKAEGEQERVVKVRVEQFGWGGGGVYR